MGTVILKGSIGKYVSPSSSKCELGDSEFVVTQDTCMEAEKIPVRFNGASSDAVCWISMEKTKFVNPLTEDY